MEVKGKFYLFVNAGAVATPSFIMVDENNRVKVTTDARLAQFFERQDIAQMCCDAANRNLDVEVIVCKAERNIPKTYVHRADTSAA